MPAAHRLSGLTGYPAARDWAEQQPATGRKNATAGPVTIVADSLAATFEAEEILYELRAFAVSVELSPFGYLFSLIQHFSTAPEYVLPDRRDISYSTPCLAAYLRHLRAVCERRGASLLGAPESRRAVFHDERPVEPADLLQVPRGRITEAGVRGNITLVLRFLCDESSASPTDAEFARAQLWQWVRHETGVLDSGRIISAALFASWLDEEAKHLQQQKDEAAAVDPMQLAAAQTRLAELTTAAELAANLGPKGYRAPD